jgi:hypothetical protein
MFYILINHGNSHSRKKEDDEKKDARGTGARSSRPADKVQLLRAVEPVPATSEEFYPGCPQLPVSALLYIF